MDGWLVVNHFINTKPKFSKITEWIIKAADMIHVQLWKKTNMELAGLLSNGTLPDKKPDFVLFWDKDIRLARLLESMGLRVFNCADAIEACDDKALTYLKLLNHGIRMPKTIAAPAIFSPIHWEASSFPYDAAKAFGFPLVVKECFGSFGEQVYLVKTMQELIEVMNHAETRPLILQEYIKSSHGKDLRIHVVGGKVVACMHRYSVTGDFRANVTNGGLMKPYEPDKSQCEMAVNACQVLGLDFAGVDLLFGENDEPILCEINSNAHFINIYNTTRINVADFIMRYIKTEMEGTMAK